MKDVVQTIQSTWNIVLIYASVLTEIGFVSFFHLIQMRNSDLQKGYRGHTNTKWISSSATFLQKGQNRLSLSILVSSCLPLSIIEWWEEQRVLTNEYLNFKYQVSKDSIQFQNYVWMIRYIHANYIDSFSVFLDVSLQVCIYWYVRRWTKTYVTLTLTLCLQ